MQCNIGILALPGPTCQRQTHFPKHNTIQKHPALRHVPLSHMLAAASTCCTLSFSPASYSLSCTLWAFSHAHADMNKSQANPLDLPSHRHIAATSTKSGRLTPVQPQWLPPPRQSVIHRDTQWYTVIHSPWHIGRHTGPPSLRKLPLATHEQQTSLREGHACGR